MNILITSVGRRSYLVDYFREVVAPIGGQVVTANSEFYTAGLLAGDRRYAVPRIADPGYLSALLKITEEEEVGLVLSLFDVDLPVLAGARDRFMQKGAELVVSDPDTIDIANDKWRMFEFLSAQGIATPRTWLDPNAAVAAVAAGEAAFPLVVKPRWGMGSIGIIKVHSQTHLHAIASFVRGEVARTYLAMMAPERLHEAVLVQEFVPGPEYGADVFNDLSGRHLATAVKRKISMRGGETDVAVTVAEPELDALCARISSLLRHRGNLDLDLIWPEGGQPQVLEFNARFGGGYPFSHLAGARFPGALVEMAQREAPDPGRVEPGVFALKDILPRRFDVDLGLRI